MLKTRWLCMRKLCPSYQVFIRRLLRHTWHPSLATHSQPSDLILASCLTQWVSQGTVFQNCHGSSELAGGRTTFSGQLAPESSLILRGLATHTIPEPWALVARKSALGKVFQRGRRNLPLWINCLARRFMHVSKHRSTQSEHCSGGSFAHYFIDSLAMDFYRTSSRIPINW